LRSAVLTRHALPTLATLCFPGQERRYVDERTS
jgi:hypothetical protein